ncbi:MAG: hypothetical protein L0387_02245 [Acidobacteria bacterium]|nr:hypothetical protein [Acidobacteriota bacterium]
MRKVRDFETPLRLMMLLGLLLLLPPRGVAELLIRPPFQPDPAQTIQLQRTLTLLMNSRPDQRNPVRVLFYGQSITMQEWWLQVAAYLRDTYPHADLTIENRAISSMQADALASAAHADVIPYQPDLIIFHAWGYESGMDEFLRTIRTYTTAEVLLQGDHVVDSNWRNDETDPDKVRPADSWQYRNYVSLPRLAAQYGACFAGIRTEWRRYLQTNAVHETSLLVNVHLNTDGNRLLAELLSAFLAPRSFASPLDPFKNKRVQTLSGPELGWHSGILDVTFAGSQLNVVYDHQAAGPIRVEIDGKAPARIPELYGFTRVSDSHALPWPAILRVQWETPLIEEQWTMTPLEVSPQGHLTFSVSGSVTGPDGEGTSLSRFVSNSGRVIIEPRDWGLVLAVVYGKSLPAPSYRATWKAVRRFLAEFEPRASPDSANELSEPIAIGLADGPHRLRLIADDGRGGGVRALRAFSPSGAAVIRGEPYTPGLPEGRLRLFRVGETNQLLLPTTWTGYQLEYTAKLGSKREWEPITSAPTSADGVTQIDHWTARDAGFYRLRLTNASPTESRGPATH